MMVGLLDHLWQSSLFAAGAGLLAVAFRHNAAALRFRLWFAASLKFLLPFAALGLAGRGLAQLFPQSLPPQLLAIRPAAEKLSAPAAGLVAHQPPGPDLTPLFAGLWLAGFAAVLGVRLVRWLKLRAMTGTARELAVAAPVSVKASASLLEPGLVGIFHPVVLLPEGLMARLSGRERAAILAHELSHLERGDNLTAAIHMLVEALFWFWPPVWLIGARLIAEREQACDEEVLADGHDPEIYAGSILKVCRFCIQYPLACAAGASGANLNRRVRAIMAPAQAQRLGEGQKLLLMGALLLALGLPVAEGFMTTPLAAQVRRQVAVARTRVVAELIPAAAPAPKSADRPVRRVHRHAPRPKLAAAPEAVPPQEAVAQNPPPPPAVSPGASPVQAAAPGQPPAAAEPPKPASVKAAVLALDPRGEGDPEAVTCRVPQALPGSRLPGPEVCETNRVWAALRAQGRQISPDGRTLVATVERYGAGSHACAVLFMAGNLNFNLASFTLCR